MRRVACDVSINQSSGKDLSCDMGKNCLTHYLSQLDSLSGYSWEFEQRMWISRAYVIEDDARWYLDQGSLDQVLRQMAKLLPSTAV